ncbi:hypothetical protein DFQ27_008799, partial [Actinomortierella ambigua]
YSSQPSLGFHVKSAHNQVYTIRLINGQQFSISRMTGASGSFLACPNPQCTYQATNFYSIKYHLMHHRDCGTWLPEDKHSAPGPTTTTMVRAVALAPVTARATRGTAASRGSATTVGATATRAATAILTETATTTTTTTTTVTSATSAVPPTITTTETRSRAVIRRPGATNGSRWRAPAANITYPSAPSPSSSSRAAAATAAAALAWMPVSFTSTTSTSDTSLQSLLDDESGTSSMAMVEADNRVHRSGTGARKAHDRNGSHGYHYHRHHHHHPNTNGYYHNYSASSNNSSINNNNNNNNNSNSNNYSGNSSGYSNYNDHNDYNGYNGYYRHDNYSNGSSKSSKVTTTTSTDNTVAAFQFSNFLEVALNHDNNRHSHGEERSSVDDEDRHSSYHNSSVGTSVVEIKEEEDILDIGHYRQDSNAKGPNTYWRQVGEGTMILETVTPLLPLDVIAPHAHIEEACKFTLTSMGAFLIVFLRPPTTTPSASDHPPPRMEAVLSTRIIECFLGVSIVDFAEQISCPLRKHEAVERIDVLCKCIPLIGEVECTFEGLRDELPLDFAFAAMIHACQKCGFAYCSNEKLRAHENNTHKFEHWVETADGHKVCLERKHVDSDGTTFFRCPNRKCRAPLRYRSSVNRHLKEGPCQTWNPASPTNRVQSDPGPRSSKLPVRLGQRQSLTTTATATATTTHVVPAASAASLAPAVGNAFATGPRMHHGHGGGNSHDFQGESWRAVPMETTTSAGRVYPTATKVRRGSTGGTMGMTAREGAGANKGAGQDAMSDDGSFWLAPSRSSPNGNGGRDGGACPSPPVSPLLMGKETERRPTHERSKTWFH